MTDRDESAPPTNPLPPLEQCEMTLVGVNALIRHLELHPTFANVDTHRLRAMAIAYLTSGGTTDNRHRVPLGNLHPAHHAVHTAGSPWRTSLRTHFVSLVTDMLTWLDRLSGGSTFMVHSSGTRPPNTHAVPEEARLDVFLPLVLLKEFPELRPVFAQLVQSYAQHVATVTMARWDRAKGLNSGGALHNADVPRTPSGRRRRTELIPEGSTPYRIFHGRPVGELERLLARQLGETSSLSSSFAGMGISPTPTSDPSPSKSSSPTSTIEQSPRSPPQSSSSQAPDLSTSLSPAQSPGTVYISPPDMPHIKLEYHPNDPWTMTDLIEWARMEELSSRGVPSSGRDSDAPDVNAKLRRLLGTYEEDIGRLRETIRLQEEEIQGLRQLLKREGHATIPGSPVAHGTGKGKGRAQSRGLSHATLAVSPLASSVTTRSVAGERFTMPHTPTPSHVGAHSPRRSSPPVTPVSARSAEAPAPGGATVGPRGQGLRDAGFHARHVVARYRYPFSTFAIIASVQAESAPEDWYDVLQQRIQGSTHEFVSALVNGMRKDLGLPPLAQ